MSPPHIPVIPLPFLARARRLGELVESGDLSEDDAQQTLKFVMRAAHEAAPQDKRGLRGRLVWAMSDARTDAYYARIRRQNSQIRTLADAAERAIRAGLRGKDIKAAIADVGEAMAPPPDIEQYEIALSMARWRVKWMTK